MSDENIFLKFIHKSDYYYSFMASTVDELFCQILLHKEFKKSNEYCVTIEKGIYMPRVWIFESFCLDNFDEDTESESKINAIIVDKLINDKIKNYLNKNSATFASDVISYWKLDFLK